MERVGQSSWEGLTMLENFRLKVFRAVAVQRNFRRAAEQLYLSQPAVTQQIKALEVRRRAAI
jgi:hypothetical protein